MSVSSAVRLCVLMSAGLLGYVMWLVGDRVVAAYLLIAVLVLVAGVAGYLAVLWLAAWLAGRLAPRRWREILQQRRGQLVLVTAVSLLFLYRVGMTLNRDWLPGRYHPLSFLGNAAILAATFFLARGLYRVRRGALLVFPAVALATVLLASGLHRLKGGETADVLANPGTDRIARALATLPYIAFVPESEQPAEPGVAYFDSVRSFQGLNLCASLAAPRALLMDMRGNVVHEWNKDLDPDYPWEFVRLCQNGDLLVCIQDRKLVRLDWSSRIKWVRKMRCHHDLDLAPNGDIYVLERSYGFVPIRGLPTPVRDDRVVILSPDGELKKEFSVGELLQDAVPFSRALGIWRWQLTNFRESIRLRMRNAFMFDKGFIDLLHLNTVTVVDRDYGGVLEKGNVIVCSPMIDVVAIIDPDKPEVVWQWGQGELEGPHNSRLLPNGHILIFDNGVRRNYSRIVEVDPATRQIVWSYEDDSPQKFYSPVCGGSQRLSNGNTLITDTVGGRVFEVTPEGQIAWEFFTPVPGDENMSRSRPTIYRMERITDYQDYPGLKGIRPAPEKG